MAREFALGRVFGIDIHLDVSWFFILALVTWTLATGYFPARLLGASPAVYWAMGLLAAVLLFVCVLLHELGHSVVAKAHGIPVKRVTLFIFGGVAQIAHDPRRPFVELKVALAGPLVSVAIAALGFWASQHLPAHTDAQLIGLAIVHYLWMVNTVIVLFNLLPGFPLDGGRILRAALWGWWGDLRKATRVASVCGSALGIVLLVLGGVSLVQGRWVNGLWSILLGFYLRDAAQASYQDVVVRRTLEGVPVSAVMATHVITVPGALSLRQLVDDYMLRYRSEGFPVEDEGQLRGFVTADAVKAVDSSRWPATTVREVMAPDLSAYVVRPSDDILTATARLGNTQAARLLVVEGGRLVGTVSRQDVMEWLRLKLARSGPQQEGT